ncbi:hypothetical protein KQI52_12705 [bacterium]|nr:hypothetical protein [bacterium]
MLSADAGADTITVQAGQPFTWTGTVRNTLADDQSTDIWVQARSPNYNITNSLRRWDDVTVAGGDSVSAEVTLTVPATTHNGPHNLLLRAGDFPLYDYEAWFTVMVEGGEPPPERRFTPVHQHRELVATPIPSDAELATDRAAMFRMLGVTDTTATVDAWQARVRRVNRGK